MVDPLSCSVPRASEFEFVCIAYDLLVGQYRGTLTIPAVCLRYYKTLISPNTLMNLHMLESNLNFVTALTRRMTNFSFISTKEFKV